MSKKEWNDYSWKKRYTLQQDWTHQAYWREGEWKREFANQMSKLIDLRQENEWLIRKGKKLKKENKKLKKKIKELEKE